MYRHILEVTLVAFFLVTPIWIIPVYAPIIMVCLLFILVFVPSLKRNIHTASVNADFVLIVLSVMMMYWMFSLAVIANIPFNELNKAEFWQNDGKIFFAYLPFFIYLVGTYISKEKLLYWFTSSLYVAMLIGAIGVLQFAFEFKIPFLSTRQQFVLFGREVTDSVKKKILLGAHNSHNAFGGYYLLPFSYFVNIVFEKNKKLIKVIGLIIVSTALLMAFSRSALIGAVVGGIFLGLRYYFHRFHVSKEMFFISLNSIAIIFIGMYLFSPQWQRKIDQLRTLSGWNITSRMELWEKATNLNAQAPLFGVGLSRYNDSSYMLVEVTKGVTKSEGGIIESNDAHAHNIYLHLLAETGTVGLVLFLSYWALILYLFFSRMKKTSELLFNWYSIGIAAVVALLVMGFFENTLSSPSVMFGYNALIGILLLPDKGE